MSKEYTPEQKTLAAQIKWIEERLPKLPRHMQQEVVGRASDIMIHDLGVLTAKEATVWIKACRNICDDICICMDENNIPYTKSVVSKK